jgi:hypothetical protein
MLSPFDDGWLILLELPELHHPPSPDPDPSDTSDRTAPPNSQIRQPTSEPSPPGLTLNAKFFNACATPGRVSYRLPALTTTLIVVVGCPLSMPATLTPDASATVAYVRAAAARVDRVSWRANMVGGYVDGRGRQEEEVEMSIPQLVICAFAHSLKQVRPNQSPRFHAVQLLTMADGRMVHFEYSGIEYGDSEDNVPTMYKASLSAMARAYKDDHKQRP